ncbi:MAG TPA: hypothetical protein DCY20_05470 [Firmicutes bacterium]|nr:hypothetical protein [Bacillota bacterium]
MGNCKFIKMLLVGAVWFSISYYFNSEIHAESRENNINDRATQIIQHAYYYVDEIEYEVPENQKDDFINESLTVDIPYNIENEPLTNIENTAERQPYANVCIAGNEFDGTRTSSGFTLGKSGTRVINKTNKPITETSELSSTATVSGTITGSGGFDWKVIEATVGFEIGGSYSWTTSQATSITVDPGYWGWIDYGAHSETWKGNFYYLTESCNQSNKRYITVKGPKYKAKLAKTEKYPY